VPGNLGDHQTIRIDFDQVSARAGSRAQPNVIARETNGRLFRRRELSTGRPPPLGAMSR
jgi:hypothetical protein